MEDDLHPERDRADPTTPVRLCLHIGMPKTGTSLIQAVLRGLRAELAASGAWLPATNMAAHRIAVEAFPTHGPLPDRADVVGIRKALTFEDAVAQSRPPSGDYSTVVLSSEYFQQCVVPRLVPLLEDMGFSRGATSVIAALRRQDRMLVSGFNQGVKAMHRTTPLTWNRESPPGFDWQARLAPWTAAFGKDAVKVQVFEREAARTRSLTCLFLDACGIVYDEAAVHAVEEQRRDRENASLPADLLAFKFVANRVTRPGEVDWIVDAALRRGVGGGVYGLPTETVREIIDHYRESNRRVAAESLSEDGDLFDDEITVPTTTSLDVSAEHAAELIAVWAATRPRPTD